MFRQTGIVALCLLAAGSSVQAQQTSTRRVFKLGGTALEQPAERLSTPHLSGGRTSSNVDTSQAVAPARAARASESDGFAGIENTLATDRSFADRQRDNAIKLAEKRVEFAREQIADLQRFNQWVPAEQQPPMAVRMFPHSLSYSPVSLTDPVQSFVPRSTFSHVLMAGERELVEAELQLNVLVAERDATTTVNPQGDAETASTYSTDRERLDYVEASLQRERFLAESAEIRLTQLANLSTLTYSGLYPTLYRKLELERQRHELAAESLAAERETLESGDSPR